jgi:putative membrane protein
MSHEPSLPDPPPESAVSADDVDPRVSFANERTFLAWIRTALGLIAAGVVIAQVVASVRTSPEPRLVGMILILLGVTIGLLSYQRWRDNERRLAAHQPLSATRLPALMTTLITVVAGLAMILALWGHP